jgi:hypothetical protein
MSSTSAIPPMATNTGAPNAVAVRMTMIAGTVSAPDDVSPHQTTLANPAAANATSPRIGSDADEAIMRRHAITANPSGIANWTIHTGRP